MEGTDPALHPAHGHDPSPDPSQDRHRHARNDHGGTPRGWYTLKTQGLQGSHRP